MIPTSDTIQAAFARAPEHLKEYITSDQLDLAFYDIKKAYKLHVDHAGNLALAIDAVILGLSDFSDLPKLLAEGLSGVDADTQAKVVKDVNDKIFVPLREKTKQVALEERERAEAARRAERQVARPQIQSVEESLLAKETPVVPPLTKQVDVPVTIRVPEGSVIEQKMTAPTAPPVSTVPVPPPTPAPVPPPPRYHGADPYRESAE